MNMGMGEFAVLNSVLRRRFLGVPLRGTCSLERSRLSAFVVDRTFAALCCSEEKNRPTAAGCSQALMYMRKYDDSDACGDDDDEVAGGDDGDDARADDDGVGGDNGDGSDDSRDGGAAIGGADDEKNDTLPPLSQALMHGTCC